MILNEVNELHHLIIMIQSVSSYSHDMNQYYYYDIISLLLIKMIFQPVITIPSPESP